MQLFVKILPLKAGSPDLAGESETFECPPDVEPDTLLSFLSQKFGKLIDTAWTTTERHPRIEVGWIFPGQPLASSGAEVELLCVPQIRVSDGSLQSMFELLADQRQEFDALANNPAVSSYTVIEQPQRPYRSNSAIEAEKQ